MKVFLSALASLLLASTASAQILPNATAGVNYLGSDGEPWEPNTWYTTISADWRFTLVGTEIPEKGELPEGWFGQALLGFGTELGMGRGGAGSWFVEHDILIAFTPSLGGYGGYSDGTHAAYAKLSQEYFCDLLHGAGALLRMSSGFTMMGVGAVGWKMLKLDYDYGKPTKALISSRGEFDPEVAWLHRVSAAYSPDDNQSWVGLRVDVEKRTEKADRLRLQIFASTEF